MCSVTLKLAHNICKFRFADVFSEAFVIGNLFCSIFLYRIKTGICFDYASLMTALLRTQKIPTKLVVGYSGTAYHAWISVWTEEEGWIDGVIFFDGSVWHRMDPTFASSGAGDPEIQEFILNGNYTVKYLY